MCRICQELFAATLGRRCCLLTLPQRATNWHFYNREEELLASFEQQSRQAQRNSVLMLFYVQKKLAEAGQKNASAMNQ
ncbi:hypothetical protein FGA82_00820 [Pseudomonas fluorescens]|nr:hypothetical protein FGA82_00820 [Pseudomonas fluorescens]